LITNIIKKEIIILKSLNLKRHSKLIVAFSFEDGLIKIFANNNLKNFRSSITDILDYGQAEMKIKGRSFNLTNFKITTDFKSIRKSIIKICSANLVIESYLKIIPEEVVEKELFINLKDFLININQSENDKQTLREVINCLHFLIQNSGYSNIKEINYSFNQLKKIVYEIEKVFEGELISKHSLFDLILDLKK